MKKSVDPKTRRLLGEIIEKNLDYLVRFAMFRVGNRYDAEDIVHDAVVALLDRAKAQDILPENIKMYLYRIVYNRCNDFYRRCQRPEPISIDAENLIDIPTDDDILDMEEIARLNGLLDALPRKEAEPVRMHLMDGLSFVEISQILSIPPSTIKSRFKSGLEKLKILYFNNQ